MGIFDFFRGRRMNKTAVTAPPEKEQNHFLTNAEDFGFAKIELGITGKVRVDGIIAITEFQKQAESRNLSFRYSVMYVSLLEEGALTVPVVLNLGEKAYTLYFIYNEEDLLKYKDLLNQVGRTKYPNLIYFSAIPIYEGYEPKKIIEPFQLADLRVEKDAELSGEYAMWWKGADEQFSQSETCDLLKKLYDVFKGYETYLLGYLVRQIRIKEEQELTRMKLPETPVTFILHGPEEQKIVLEVSQEKGIRFFFPMKEVNKDYRNRFLKGVLVDFLSTRIYLEQHNAAQDEEQDPNSYDWFSFMARMIAQKEAEGESIEVIGGFNLQ